MINVMGVCNISLMSASVEGKRRCYDWRCFRIQIEVKCSLWRLCLATFPVPSDVLGFFRLIVIYPFGLSNYVIENV